MSYRSKFLHFALPVALAGAAHGIGAQADAPRELSAIARVVMEAAFSRADGNDDGMVSKAEAIRLPVFAARFDELDVDHDGALNLEEFALGFAAPL
jgi:EF hand